MPSDGRPVVRKGQQRRELRGRQPPACQPVGERHRCGERGARLGRRRGQLRRRHPHRVDAHRQRDGSLLEADERREDQRPGRLGVELGAGAAGNDDGLPAAQPHRGVAVGDVHVAREPVELVHERSLEHARLQLDVAAEEAQGEALEAAQRAGAASGVLRLGDRRVPVGLHAELGGADLEGVARGGERDRLRLDRGEAALQLGARLRGAHPADVDARDRDACGDPPRRAARRRSPRRARRPRARQRRAALSRAGNACAAAGSAQSEAETFSRRPAPTTDTSRSFEEPSRAGAPSSRGSDRWRRPAAGSRTFPRQSGTPSRRAATSRRGGRA